jgi:REP element-mobilizing transposase RayT
MGRGCRGQPIFENTADCEHFAYLLTDVVERFGWTICDWVFMPNHHHLVVKLEEPNLDRGMHRLQGLFGQRWNERNDSSGHVFFRRYKNVALTDSLAASRVLRYVDLNPVRGGLSNQLGDWEWSGYLANIGRRSPLPFHNPDEALRVMTPHIGDPEEARFAYARLVSDRLAVTRRIGTPNDSRPSLGEIIVRGDLGSLREANVTWWYSTYEIAAFIGCGQKTVHRWLTSPLTARRGSALKAWAFQAAQ